MLHTFFQKIKENRDWLLIGFGLILIIVSVVNLVGEDLDVRIARLGLNEPVDQEGFAPAFVPKPSDGEISEVEQPLSPILPDRIVIEKIDLDAPVEIAESTNVSISGQEVIQYLVPEKFAAGWHEGTAPLGVPGNTVITGHHNAYGKVFEKLIDVKVGDTVVLLSGREAFEYVVANKMILPEKGEPLDVRLENARWIMPSRDERVTLITCWPEDTNSHRLLLVAVPVATGGGQAASLEQSPTKTPFRLSTPIASLLEALSFTPTPTLGAAQTPVPGADEIIFPVRNNGQFSVNIRDFPSMDGDILGSFPRNTDANAIGRNERITWLLIVYGDIRGWVDAELVDAITPFEDLPIVEP